MVSYLFVSYEFADPLFSGNGTFCRTIVSGLLKGGAEVDITVVCASPSVHGASVRVDTSERLSVVQVGVDATKWGRLDRYSDWETFRDNVGSLLNASPCVEWQGVAGKRFFDTVFCVDWSGFISMQSILQPPSDLRWGKTVYLNFRVFSIGVASEEDRNFYRQWEVTAARSCQKTIVLSRYDKQVMSEMSGVSDIGVLMCPVRDDILEAAKLPLSEMNFPKELATLASSNPKLQTLLHLKHRIFVTCCVRLSPEKEPHRFVEFVRTLKGSGFIPLMVGAAGDVEYATKVRSMLKAEWLDQCVVLESFVGPHELAAILRLSVVNIHPCSYDAFGMTISEAAICLCPTIILENDSGAIDVGATSLLTLDGCICAKPSDNLRGILEDTDRLSRVASIAQSKAKTYDTTACGEAVLKLIG